MGLADRKKREAGVERYLSFLRQQHCALETICAEAEKVAVTEENQDILRYQLASAIYGRDFYKFQVDWFENLLCKIRNGEL